MKIATWWLYGRFSDPTQGRGDSEHRQLTSLDRFVRERKIPSLHVKQIPVDRGRSAFHGHHISKGHFGKWLVGIGDRAGDHLVVENVDRLSRLPYLDANDLISRILRAKVTVHVCGFPYELTRQSLNSNDGVIYMLAGEIQRARRESARKSEFSVRFWDQAAKNGRLGKPSQHKCPSWLRWSPEESRYELIPERAEVVRLIYKLATKEMLGTKRIEEYLVKNKVPRFAKRPWTWQYIQKILTTRATCGEFQLHKTTYDEEGKRILEPVGDPIPGYWPAVVKEKVWQKAQTMRVKRTISRRGGGLTEAPNLFHSRIKCSLCGNSMYLRASFTHPASGERRRHHYYNCSRKGRDCEMVKGWPVRQVEERVLTYIANELDPAMLSGDEAAQASLAGVIEVAQESRRKETELKARHAKIMDLLEDEELPDSARVGFYERLKIVEGELSVVIARAEAAEAEANHLQSALSQVLTTQAEVRKLLNRLDDDDTRVKIKVAIAAVVSEVRVDTDSRWIEVVFATGISRRIWESRFEPVKPGVVRLLPEKRLHTKNGKPTRNLEVPEIPTLGEWLASAKEEPETARDKLLDPVSQERSRKRSKG